MCTSKSEKRTLTFFSFLFYPKYFISCTAKLEREIKYVSEDTNS